MQNITINNIDYNNVPWFDANKQGGGTARFYDRSGELDFLGAEIEKIGEVYNKTTALKDTAFHGWSPSTTATTIIASENLTNKPSLDMVNYEYALRWKFIFLPVYNSSAVNKARTVKCVMNIWQLMQKRANSLANIAARNHAGNACATLTSAAILEYWNAATTPAHTYTWSASYGVYAAATAATFSNSTSNTPTLTIKTPSVSARCSATYQSTANMGCLDEDESTVQVIGEFYKYKPRGILLSEYDELCELYNSAT